MTDSEIVQLFDSVNGEEAALKSLLPKSTFKVKITNNEYYTIVDKEYASRELKRYKPIHKYSVSTCFTKDDNKSGVCLDLWLHDSSENKELLRTLQKTDPPKEFMIRLWSITYSEIKGIQYTVLNFAEPQISQPN